MIPNEKRVAEGRAGFFNNRHNPYHRETDDAAEWERGYNQAYFSNLGRVLIKEALQRGEKVVEKV